MLFISKWGSFSPGIDWFALFSCQSRHFEARAGTFKIKMKDFIFWLFALCWPNVQCGSNHHWEIHNLETDQQGTLEDLEEQGLDLQSNQPFCSQHSVESSSSRFSFFFLLLTTSSNSLSSLWLLRYHIKVDFNNMNLHFLVPDDIEFRRSAESEGNSTVAKVKLCVISYSYSTTNQQCLKS